MNVFDLVASLSLDDHGYESGLNKAESKGKSFTSKVGNGLKNVAKVGAAAMAAAGTAVVAFGAKSVKTGAEFDKAMSQVAATQGRTMDELRTDVGKTSTSFGDFKGNLEDFAKFLGKNTAFSASQAAEALNYMALAGYDTQKSMDMLPNVLNLAAAGSMDLAQASDMVTDAQSALGLSTKETEQLVDKLAKGSSKSNASVQQLGEAMLTIGGTAKQLKGGTTELTQALGLLADNGVKGAEGGTALRNILLNLTPKSKEAAKAMEQIGLQAYDAEGNMRPLKDVFGDLNKGLEGMSDQQKSQILSKIFNKVDLKSVNALLATSADRWDELSTAIDGSKGAADAMAKTQLDNLNGDVTLLKSAFEGAQIAISEKVTPKLREFVQLGTDGLSRVTDALEKKGFSGAIEVIGQIFEQAVNKIAELLPKLIEVAVSILNALVRAIATNLPKLVPPIIEGILSIVTTIAEQLPSLIAKLVPAILSTLPLFLEAGIKIIKSLGKGIMQAAKYVYNNFDKILDKVFGFLEKALPKLLNIGIKLIGQLALGIIKALPKIIECLGKLVARMLEFFLNNWPKILQAGLKLTIQLAVGIIKALPQIVAALLKVIVQLIATIVKSYPKFLAEGVKLIGQLIKGILKCIKNIIEAAKNIGKSFIDAIKSFDFIKLGADIINGIVKGIKGFAGKAVDAAKNVGGKILNAFKRFFHIASPSKVMEKLVGEQVMNGFIKGLKNKAKETEKTAKTLAKVYLDAKAAALLKKSGSLGASAEVEFWKGVLEQTKKGTNAYKAAANALKEARKRIKTSTIKDAKNLVKSLKESNKLSLSDEVKFWKNMLKTVKKGSKAYKEIKEQISKAKSSLTKQENTLMSNYAKDVKNLKKEYKTQSDELLKNLKEQKQQIQDNLKATIDALEETYTKAVDDRRKSIVGQLSLFSEFKADEKIGKNALQANLKSQITALEEWDSILDNLEGKLGADSPLLQDLQEMGVQSLDTLKSISSMSDAELKEYVWMYNRKNQLARERAEQESKQLRADTDKQIAEARKLADEQTAELEDQFNKDMKALKKNFEKETKALSKQLEKDFKSLGVNMAKGLSSGLKSQLKAVTSEIDSILGTLADKVGNTTSKSVGTAASAIATTMKTTTTKTKNSDATGTTVYMTVNGAKGQDVNELATVVSKKLGAQVKRGREAWT